MPGGGCVSERLLRVEEATPISASGAPRHAARGDPRNPRWFSAHIWGTTGGPPNGSLSRGLTVAGCTVELVMSRNGIAGLTGRPKFRRVPNQPTASDLVDRAFPQTEPDRLWVTDIERHEAFFNLAVVKGHRGQFVAAGWCS